MHRRLFFLEIRLSERRWWHRLSFCVATQFEFRLRRTETIDHGSAIYCVAVPRGVLPRPARGFRDFGAADWRNGNHRRQPLSPRARVCPHMKLVSAVVHLRAPAVPLEPCTSRRTVSSADYGVCANVWQWYYGRGAHSWRTSAWLRGVQVLQMKGQWVSGTGRRWRGREKASRRESH